MVKLEREITSITKTGDHKYLVVWSETFGGLNASMGLHFFGKDELEVYKKVLEHFDWIDQRIKEIEERQNIWRKPSSQSDTTSTS